MSIVIIWVSFFQLAWAGELYLFSELEKEMAKLRVKPALLRISGWLRAGAWVHHECRCSPYKMHGATFKGEMHDTSCHVREATCGLTCHILSLLAADIWSVVSLQ